MINYICLVNEELVDECEFKAETSGIRIVLSEQYFKLSCLAETLI